MSLDFLGPVAKQSALLEVRGLRDRASGFNVYHRMSTYLFATHGFVGVPGLLPSAECDVIAGRVAASLASSGGTRCLLSQSWCESLAGHIRGNSILLDLIPGDYLAVQCSYFEKSASRNWLVPVHQDLSIPVAERVSEFGLRGWSEKEGSLFVHWSSTL